MLPFSVLKHTKLLLLPPKPYLKHAFPDVSVSLYLSIPFWCLWQRQSTVTKLLQIASSAHSELVPFPHDPSLHVVVQPPKVSPPDRETMTTELVDSGHPNLLRLVPLLVPPIHSTMWDSRTHFPMSHWTLDDDCTYPCLDCRSTASMQGRQQTNAGFLNQPPIVSEESLHITILQQFLDM